MYRQRYHEANPTSDKNSDTMYATSDKKGDHMYASTAGRLKSAAGLVGTTSSQLSKLTHELDRIHDRSTYRGAAYLNSVGGGGSAYSTANRISDKYMQRYKSIYSLDSPPQTPTKLDGERYSFATRHVGFTYNGASALTQATAALKLKHQELMRQQTSFSQPGLGNAKQILISIRLRFHLQC